MLWQVGPRQTPIPNKFLLEDGSTLGNPCLPNLLVNFDLKDTQNICADNYYVQIQTPLISPIIYESVSIYNSYLSSPLKQSFITMAAVFYIMPQLKAIMEMYRRSDSLFQH